MSRPAARVWALLGLGFFIALAGWVWPVWAQPWVAQGGSLWWPLAWIALGLPLLGLMAATWWDLPGASVLPLVALWPLAPLLPSLPGLNPLNLSLALAVGAVAWSMLTDRANRATAAEASESGESGLRDSTAQWPLSPRSAQGLAVPLAWGMGLPLVWGCALAWAADPGADTLNLLWDRVAKPFAYYLGGAWLVARALRRSPAPAITLQALVVTLAGSLSAVAALMVLQVARLGRPLQDLIGDREFMTPMGMHANELGMLMALGIGPLLAVALTPVVEGDATARTLRRVCVSALLLLTMALILSFSRGALLALLVIVLLLGAQSRRRRKLALVATVLSAGLWLASPSALKERVTAGLDSEAISRTSDASRDALTAGRVAGWMRLWPEVEAHPWFGQGIGSTVRSAAWREGRYRADHPHNIFLELLMDLGFVGLLMAGGLALWLLRAVWRLSRSAAKHSQDLTATLAQGGFAAALGGLAMAGTTAYYLPNAAQAPMWFLLALLFSRSRP
jgi:O-antigen ligase